MFEGWSRRSGAAPAACWVTAHAVKFSNSQPRIVGSPPKIVRFSNLVSWVTAPLAPGGAGRQRERLLWSCCDQGSAPAVELAELATKAGGRGPPGMLPSWCGSTLERWCTGGASTSPPSLESLLPPQQQMHPSWEARTTDQEYVVLNLKG